MTTHARQESLESRLFLAATPVNLDISHLTGNEAEPCITIDKTHPKRLFATSKITPEVGLLASYSLDGGATWNSRRVADGNDNLPVAASAPYATFDDGVLMGLMHRYRQAGFEAYLLPQGRSLPMQNRREDLLIVRH